MRTIGLVALLLCPAVCPAQTAGEAALDLQVSYATHAVPPSNGQPTESGEHPHYLPIDPSGIQISGVTGFSWKISGTAGKNRDALVQVRWSRGGVKLLEAALNLPDQLGAEVAFNIAPVAGLYHVDLLFSPRKDQPDRVLKTIEFTVAAPASDPLEMFEDLRDRAHQKEEVWRWKIEEINAYVVPRFIFPHCNIERIRQAVDAVSASSADPGAAMPLMAEADAQWRIYFAAKIERLNGERNKRAERLPGERDELKVRQRDTEEVNKSLEKAQAIRAILQEGSRELTSSDELIKGLQNDLERKKKALADKEAEIKNLEADVAEYDRDIEAVGHDLDSVGSQSTFERDKLNDELRDYQKQCPR